MSKHRIELWKYDPTTGEVYDPANAAVIAEVGGSKSCRDRAGRLLAAAPELLAELQSVAQERARAIMARKRQA